MKAFILAIITFVFTHYLQAQSLSKAQNIFIITTDGFRWQEIFNGADEVLINDTRFVSDTALLKDIYWNADTLLRRKKLMPFLWTVLAKNGQIYGNRNYNNKVNVKNIYKFSYPGYSEIFTGFTSMKFVPNKPIQNTNTNILQYLNAQQAYKGKVVAFTSWDILPFILNEQSNNFQVNAGYEKLDETDTSNVFKRINQVQENVAEKEHTRYDELTYLSAKEYIKSKHPKVVFLGLGETDEFAHSKKYDAYLNAANKVDKMIAELWYYIQSDPFYKNNTTLIITTDHGRGSKPTTWNQHNTFVKGSGDTWIAMLGPNIVPIGEMRNQQHIYQKQIAATIASLLGETFETEHAVGKAIDLPAMPINALFRLSVVNK